MAKKLKAVAVFEGVSVQRVADDLDDYGHATSRILLLQNGAAFYLQVRSRNGTTGGEAVKDSGPCPGAPGCT